jgi:hypothetical protein
MGTDLASGLTCALRMRTGGTFHAYTRPLAILVARRNHTDRDNACVWDGLKGERAHHAVRVVLSNRTVLVADRGILDGVDWGRVGRGSDSSGHTKNCKRAAFDRA